MFVQIMFGSILDLGSSCRKKYVKRNYSKSTVNIEAIISLEMIELLLASKD